MNRLHRALGILLLLRQGKTVSATVLAERFEVSVRTVYRDLEALSELGVPVYAEMGRTGGFRLLEGYFLPPVMLTTGEATSLLLGLTLLRRLRVTPFPTEIETAEYKLLAGLPDPLRTVLARAPQFIGFEDIPPDLLHREPLEGPASGPAVVPIEGKAQESQVVNTFLRAILEDSNLRLRYRSPYRGEESVDIVAPDGLLWDRDLWYLSGRRIDRGNELRLWRADRVLAIDLHSPRGQRQTAFDINQLLGRTWLRAAMTEWMSEAPVKLRVTAQQAARLKLDWYYRYAHYEELLTGQVLMTFGEDKPELVFDLVRWLGPGAELLEPHAWRAALRTELLKMLDCYRPDDVSAPATAR